MINNNTKYGWQESNRIKFINKDFKVLLIEDGKHIQCTFYASEYLHIIQIDVIKCTK